MMYIWLILAGLVVYLLVAKPGKRSGESSRHTEDPDDLLTTRFINGEITEEEYKKNAESHPRITHS